MPERVAEISGFESRRRLLTSESNLNRASAREECAAVSRSIHQLTHRTRSNLTLLASTLRLVADLTASSGPKPSPSPAKERWPATLLRWAGMISRVWLCTVPPKPNAAGRTPASQHPGDDVHSTRS